MRSRNLSDTMTVIGLVNGMIGGIILVMPILALHTGYTLIGPISIVSGFFSYFSSLLCLRHLKNFKDLDEAVLYHFNNRRVFKIFYDINIMISLTVLLILYFGLICEQWAGLTQKSHLIPILNAFALFPIVYIMKKYQFGASLLAYGILSIIGYCLFLLWMWATAPSGAREVPASDHLFVDLAAALAQGFAIQTFFIPILKQNPKRQNYSKLLLLTYLIGTIVYTYIGYTGAYAIVNRKSPVPDPATVEQYFDDKQWEVMTIQILYLVHLYSAFPQFLLVAKKRFFSIFAWKESQDVNFKEVVYVAATIFISLVIRLTEVKASIIIELNGSIVSFFFIYLIPIGLHLKCVYFSKKGNTRSTEEEQKEVETSRQGQGTNQIESERPTKTYPSGKQTATDNMLRPNVEECGQKCGCDVHYTSKWQERGELFLIACMLICGLFTMFYTLITIGDEQD